MNWIDGVHTFPKYIKIFLLFFVLTLTLGYSAGFKFIVRTTNLNPTGIEENYIGNEDNEGADTLKFRKSEGEIIASIHTHMLSFSLIFFATGCILLTIPFNRTLKKILLIEPFISVIITFGGLWVLWLGYSWTKYFVMVSGILITATFIAQVFFIINGLLGKPTKYINQM